jgi:hypothetical protein
VAEKKQGAPLWFKAATSACKLGLGVIPPLLDNPILEQEGDNTS